MGLVAIREGIQTRLKTIRGLKVYDRPPESLGELPAAFVLPISGDYDTEFGDGIRYDFEITLIVSRAADIARAQSEVDPYIDRSGDKSVYAAIDGDVTLDGNADTCRVTRFKDYGGLTYAGTVYLGVKFEMEAWI